MFPTPRSCFYLPSPHNMTISQCILHANNHCIGDLNTQFTFPNLLSKSNEQIYLILPNHETQQFKQAIFTSNGLILHISIYHPSQHDEISVIPVTYISVQEIVNMNHNCQFITQSIEDLTHNQKTDSFVLFYLVGSVLGCDEEYEYFSRRNIQLPTLEWDVFLDPEFNPESLPKTPNDHPPIDSPKNPIIEETSHCKLLQYAGDCDDDNCQQLHYVCLPPRRLCTDPSCDSMHLEDALLPIYLKSQRYLNIIKTKPNIDDNPSNNNLSNDNPSNSNGELISPTGSPITLDKIYNFEDLTEYLLFSSLRLNQDALRIDNPDHPCSICCGLFFDGEDVATAPCFHHFHQDCLQDWIEKQYSDNVKKYQYDLEQNKHNISYNDYQATCPECVISFVRSGMQQNSFGR